MTIDLLNTAFYLSGPMTGLPNHNRNKFDLVTATLRAEQLIIFNPSELTQGIQDPNKPYEYYLREALKMQLQSDATIFLPDWTRSRGALREFNISVDLNHPMFLYSDIPYSLEAANPENLYFVDCTLIRMR